MGKKYYAVKVGRIPGIYMTWDDCKTQTEGYSGAVYKSFTDINEADAFINMDASVSVNTDISALKDDEIIAYVDGSYLDATKEYAYGVVIFHRGEEIHLSGKSSNPEMATMRNVAGEISGSMTVMQYALENKCKKLTIYHDYEGISKWCLGIWKANKSGTIKYREFYESLRNVIEISFIKVKGHSGDKYNDKADELAKNALGIST